MQVRGKTLRCFSVILAFSKSLHETCRLLRALHTFFFLQAVYLGLTLCAVKLYVNLQSLSGMLHLHVRHGLKEALFLVARGAAHRMRILQAWHNSTLSGTFRYRTAAYYRLQL